MNAKRRRAIGYLVSAVPGTVVLPTAALKISHHPSAVENFVTQFGISESLLTPLGVLEIVCTALYFASLSSGRFVGWLSWRGHRDGATRPSHTRIPISTANQTSAEGRSDSRVAVALGRTESIT